MSQEPTFSVSVHLKARPALEVSVDRDQCWLNVNTFLCDAQGRSYGVSSLTIFLPDDPADLLAMADDLQRVAEMIAAAKAAGQVV